jgi:micrococcal nuclease
MKWVSAILVAFLAMGCGELRPIPELHIDAVDSRHDSEPGTEVRPTAPESTKFPDLQFDEPEPQAFEPTTFAAVKSVDGKVVRILDGDTIDILLANNTTRRVRLNGIDAPETGQPFGKTAKDFLSDLIGGKIVRVVVLDEDRYGRAIGDVYTGDGRLVNLQLVTAGLAWHYIQYAADRDDYAAAERDARLFERGLWADRRYVAPWDWRKLSKEERDKLR